jgi:hypothetical protein
LVKGILSIASGKNYSIEDIAEQINVDTDLMEICLLLASFSKKEENIEATLAQLKSLSSFTRFASRLKMDSELLLNLLEMSFNRIKFEDLPQIITNLRLNVIFSYFLL